MHRFIKIIFLSCLCLLFLPRNTSCETIVLKSNKTVKGNITKRTDQYVEIDIGIDMPLTFYFDEIQRIEEDTAASPEATAPHKAVVEVYPESTKKINDQQPNSSQKQDKSFLWQIETPQTTVYLLGSIHLGRKSMYPLARVIENAFDSADVLVVEVDTSKIDPQEAQAKMLSIAMYTDGQRLERNISKETLVKLRKRLRKYGFNSKDFSNFKPWFVGISLAQMQLSELGFDPNLGIDFYFVDKARGKKRIIGLETYEQQLDFLENMPYQDEILEQSLVSLNEVDAMFNDIIRAWKNGDAEQLDVMITQKGLKKYPHLEPVYQMLIFDRNVVMAEKINEYLKGDEIYFVIIGSAHLVGKKGIVALLRRDGYNVEQL